MPELPEVENVRVSLIRLGAVGQTVAEVELRRDGLRTKFPRGLKQKLKGQTVHAILRRAKYLLFETEDYYVLSHLGMTGSWRPFSGKEFEKHDHVVLSFLSKFKLVFNDPRRFGILDLVPKAELKKSPWLKHLGPEPLEPEFTAEYLFKASRGIQSSVKAFIMDQKRVVGVGNIYASEALFKSGIRPTRKAQKLTRLEAERLVVEIQKVLRRAIAVGGSTIRDYRNSEGTDGSFQAEFQVYGRKGEACVVCGTKIRAQNIVGRNTFWCVKCQR